MGEMVVVGVMVVGRWVEGAGGMGMDGVFNLAHLRGAFRVCFYLMF